MGLFTTNCYFYRNNARNKGDFKRRGHGATIWRIGRKGALVYFRCNSVGVDLDDLAPTDKIFDVSGCGGTLHLPLSDTEFPIRYLLGSVALVSLSEIRNGIAQETKRRGRILIPDYAIMCSVKRTSAGKLRSLSWEGAAPSNIFLNIWKRCRAAPWGIFKN